MSTAGAVLDLLAPAPDCVGPLSEPPAPRTAPEVLQAAKKDAEKTTACKYSSTK